MNPRKIIGALSSQGALLAAAGLVVASSAVVGSGTLAGFQATTTNPNNVFSAGILRMTNSATNGIGTNSNCTTQSGTSTTGVLSGTCKTLISTTLRAPGDVVSNTVDIANVGNVDGLLNLGMSSVSATDASTPGGSIPACGNTTSYAAQIGAVVKETSGGVTNVVSPSGATLSSLASSNVFSTARSITAGSSKTYTVELTFNATNDNTFQNCAVSPFTLTWTLDQRAATTSSAGA